LNNNELKDKLSCNGLLLEDYVEDFKTVEQRRFDRTISGTRRALILSFLGLILAIIMPVVLSKCTQTKIDKGQIDEIKNTILDTKTVIPERIELFSEDTIKVLNINVKKEFPIPCHL